MARRLIVVSNRGPLSYGRDPSGARVARRGGGGLATALRGLLRRDDVTWIASAMTDEDRAVAAEAGGASFAEEGRDGSSFRLRLLAHPPAAYAGFYDTVANGALWFLQHYLWGLASEPELGADFHAAWRDGYERVNETFADAVLAELDDDAAVCFHDYHLYLAPAFVRAARPGALLTHFVHIPWPDAEYWHALPEAYRSAVHRGLLANDVVGFHTERWRDNFVEACRELVGADVADDGTTVRFEDREVRAVAHPISIDVEEFEALRDDAAVLEEERAILARRPEYLVVRVDRTDPSKNIIRGFRAFELLLEEHPELRGRVVMLALLDPSRQTLRAYEDYLERASAEAQRVNERFAADGWQPVDLHVRDNFPQTVAAYKQFDVLLVNAIYDGMNLVAKEGAFVNTRDGLVVLSENAGAHAELAEWVVSANPFDLEDQAEGLYRALTMPAEERRRRSSAAAAYVREHDIDAWVDAQLDEIARLSGASRAV
ncbi:MAG: trehalose-6-phosphate synthase [Actinobacteria bacterium]|nr:trehalose-6-phosphate synthase [Actinomycetota bacterium]MBV8395754.1 trehalose-6-phosphate synthase [Actinomycetota bacterium]